VIDLTGLEIANASLLDEGTAAAEAMNLAHGFKATDTKQTFFVSSECHPQTIDVVKTRAEPLGIKVVVGDHRTVDLAAIGAFGALVQYPGTDGEVFDYADFAKKVHAAEALFVVAADLLSLTLLVPPGEFGADVCVGNSQRFGVPLGYGGPHAAFFATKNEFVRKLPGRIIGVSRRPRQARAPHGPPDARAAHPPREGHEQHLHGAGAPRGRRGMYAVYHGPEGLTRDRRARARIGVCARARPEEGSAITVDTGVFFDTLVARPGEAKVDAIVAKAAEKNVNLRASADGLGVSLDETTTPADIATLLELFGAKARRRGPRPEADSTLGKAHRRTSAFLTHPVFHALPQRDRDAALHRKLEGRDLSLAHSMIPLGSCTMKLNATAEMIPVTWPEFGTRSIPSRRSSRRRATRALRDLEKWLAEITGFAAVSLQPNAGSQGEYAGCW
jgi:glycine dehydrogenase